MWREEWEGKEGGHTNPISLPTRIIHEIRKHEACFLMRWCAGGHCDEDHEERDQRGVEGYMCDCWEGFGVAIEEESDEIGEFVGYYDVPGLDLAVWCLGQRAG